MKDTWSGEYKYKGFVIWSPSERIWLTEPNWSQAAIEAFKGSDLRIDHLTIADAKKWINEVGVHLREYDYLNKARH